MKVDGVEDCEVSYAEKTATVTVAAGTRPEDLTGALTGRFSGTIQK